MVSRSFVAAKHHSVRLTCHGRGAHVSMLLFADRERSERLNVPDTLKAQMSACIRPGMVLMSDMGRALASVTGSTLDWHDAISGHSRAAHDELLQELMKHDLSSRDLHANVNWFKKVAAAGDDRGTLREVEDHATAGDWVELRAELDVLVVLAAPAVDISVTPTTPPGPDDACRLFRPESGRALLLAERGVA
ncbi:MAG TPA: DUF1989 domain-containing protein [Mycobacteriales bacterium]|nr:DUF1989 domain-containing protein [Mycobacteriales bacterium]